MTTIDALTLRQYRAGRDVIDVAIDVVETVIDVASTVAVARLVDPSAFPCYIGDATPQGAARQIIGRLLDAGWRAPSAAEIRDAIEAAR